MSTIIKCKLDSDSIDKAIKEIRDYRESFNKKLKGFFNALLEDGSTEARMRLTSTMGDSIQGIITVDMLQPDGDKLTAVITLMGKDALFIEFGAGIAFNTGMQHPYAADLGYGIGTYPSEHPPNKAINPGYWYYREEGNEQVVRSIGTQASMPIYYASETMRKQAIKRAIEVFRR